MLGANRALERQLLGGDEGRVSPRDATVPQAWGPWEYYLRYPEGSQRRLHCRRPRGGGPEQIMLDENVLAKGRRGFSVSDAAVSFDHKLLAYAVDEDGSERNTLWVRDLATGRDLRRHDSRRCAAAWCGRPTRNGCSTWAAIPPSGGSKVFRHRLGTPVAEDELVSTRRWRRASPCRCGRPLSDRFLVIESGDFSTTDVQLVDLADPTAAPRPIVQRKAGTKYAVSDLGDRLIFMTNADGAIGLEDRRQAAVGRRRCALEEIVPHVAGPSDRGFHGV